MKTMFKSFSMLVVAACAGMSIVSCTADKDLYNPEVVEKNVKAEYADNFVKKFGAIAADQSWDFTSGPVSHLSVKATRGTEGEWNPQIVESASNDFYEVQASTLDYLKSELPEGKNNTRKGSAFSLTMPGNDFTIVPIYVGGASLSWDLYLVLVGPDGKETEIKVWSKGHRVQTSADGKNWKTLGKAYADNTMSAAHTRAPYYNISGVPALTNMFLRLKTSARTIMSSLDGQMVALEECPLPTNLPPMDPSIKGERKVMIIGCEDKKLSSGDKDFNDVVFMIYGNPNIPGKHEVREFPQTASKRYMIEDLGATDDFDFNDIVLDVTATRTKYIDYVDGEPVEQSEKYGPWRDEVATLRHLGGILPFTVTVGNTPLSWEPNIDENGVVRGDAKGETVTVSGWDPEANNVTVSVEGRGENAGYQTTFKFPKEGEVPMIIATEVSQKWSNERVSIQKMW